MSPKYHPGRAILILLLACVGCATMPPKPASSTDEATIEIVRWFRVRTDCGLPLAIWGNPGSIDEAYVARITSVSGCEVMAGSRRVRWLYDDYRSLEFSYSGVSEESMRVVVGDHRPHMFGHGLEFQMRKQNGGWVVESVEGMWEE